MAIHSITHFIIEPEKSFIEKLLIRLKNKVKSIPMFYSIGIKKWSVDKQLYYQDIIILKHIVIVVYSIAVFKGPVYSVKKTFKLKII